MGRYQDIFYHHHQPNYILSTIQEEEEEEDDRESEEEEEETDDKSVSPGVPSFSPVLSDICLTGFEYHDLGPASLSVLQLDRSD